MKKIIYKIVLTVWLGFGLYGCTDLTPEFFDDVEAGNFLQDPSDYAAALITPYQQLTDFSLWHWIILDNTSDALTIYTHQSGWNNDRHRRTDTHELRAADDKRFPLGGTVFDPIFNGIAESNGALEFLRNAEDQAIAAPFIAEARVLRAWYYLLGLDVYGGMPIVETAAPTPGNLPTRSSRPEVFQFVVSELEAVIPDLPSKNDPNYPGFPRIGKETAQAILAQTYLNGEVYTRTDFTQPGTGTTYWDECIDLCDAIIQSGNFSLHPNFFEIFDVNNEVAESELLFYVDHEAGITGGGIGYPVWSLTNEWINSWYPLAAINAANGPAVEPAFYRYYLGNDKYQDDVRMNFDPATARGTFLPGVQFTPGGDTLKDAQGRVIDHEIDFFLRPSDGPDDYEALYEGVRIIKWQPDENSDERFQGNGFGLIRYADILLMKAEATLRNAGATSLNGNIDESMTNGEADALFNQVRSRVGASEISGVTLRDIYDERGRFLRIVPGH
ncbi:MAG: RagB/SusD family nutrient uptake outer membrane protein, partial [Bacteroidota bacterium]